MAIRSGAALVALAASIAIPFSVRADPPQPAAAGFLLPAGTVVTIVLDQEIDSATVAPGAVIAAHLRDPIVVGGRTLAPAGSPVRIVVTETRRAGDGVSGEVVLDLAPVRLTDRLDLPLRFVHADLSPLLIAADPEDVILPPSPKAQPLKRGFDVILPRGTRLRARTAASVQATSSAGDTLVTPPPYRLSTEKPYAPFTPIPLATYNPRFTPAPRNAKPSPPPPPSSSPSASTASPSPAPTPSPAATPSSP
jgi:hypothetical protein